MLNVNANRGGLKSCRKTDNLLNNLIFLIYQEPLSALILYRHINLNALCMSVFQINKLIYRRILICFLWQNLKGLCVN